VTPELVLGDSADAERYRARLEELFDLAVIENHLKWPHWERERETGLRVVDRLNAHGFRVRGHNLVWPAGDTCPRTCGSLRVTSGLRKRIEDHIADEATALRGKVIDWT